jgi:hypothetical protein
MPFLPALMHQSSTDAGASALTGGGGCDEFHDQLIRTMADQVAHPSLINVGLNAALTIDPAGFVCSRLDQGGERLVGEVWGLLKAEMQVGMEIVYTPAVSRCYGNLWAFWGRLAEALAINALNKVSGSIDQNRVIDRTISVAFPFAGQRHCMSPSGDTV